MTLKTTDTTDAGLAAPHPARPTKKQIALTTEE